MNLFRARFLLAKLFLISFLLQAGMLLNLVRQQALTLQEAGHTLELLGKLYSVPGTMVIVGAFARSTSHSAQEKVHPSTFYIALSVSIIWNVFFLGVTWLYYKANSAEPEQINSVFQLAPSFEFLIAGVLAFFFASPSTVSLAPGTDFSLTATKN